MTLVDPGRVKVQVYVSLEVGQALVARAGAARRSVSAEAALMLEAALAGALPGGVVGTSEAARSAGLASGASGSQSVGPVSRVLAGLGEGEPSGPETGAADGLAADRSDAGAANASSPSPSPAGDAVHRAAAERQAAELLGDVDFSARRGVCSFDTPKGTKCKACGKKH